MDTYPGNIKRKVVFRNMYLNSLVESECCGCTACEQICPRNCIQMRKNEEGFLYPVVNNDKCIKCGLCEKVLFIFLFLIGVIKVIEKLLEETALCLKRV